MTDQERNQVLKMIEEGRISPEEGLKLLQALEQDKQIEQVSQVGQTVQDGQIPPVPPIPPIPPIPPVDKVDVVQPVVERSGMEVDPRITSIKDTVQRLWQIPLWIGIGITLLSAIGMFLIMRGPGFNFWFYFMVLPLLLGVLIIALAVGSHKARWLFLDIQEKSERDGHPKRIFFGFPVPFRFIAWVIRTFRHFIPEMDREMRGVNIDEILTMFEAGVNSSPMIVNVDEGEGGDKVKVFIG
jgi:hypothetical protein